MVTAFLFKIEKANLHFVLRKVPPPAGGGGGGFTAPDHTHDRPMDGIYQLF